MQNRQRDLAIRVLAVPQLLVQGLQCRDLVAVHGQDQVARFQSGPFSRAFLADPDDLDPAFLFDRRNADPGSMTRRCAARLQHVDQDRFEQVDRNKHIAGKAAVLADDYLSRLAQQASRLAHGASHSRRLRVNCGVCGPLPRSRSSCGDLPGRRKSSLPLAG